MEKSVKSASGNESTTIFSVETWDEPTVRDILKNFQTDKATEYEHLVKCFQERAERKLVTEVDSKKDDPLVNVLSKLQALSASLTDAHASLVNLILRCDWCSGSVDVFNLFLQFVASLLTSQPAFVDICLRSLIRRLSTVPFETKPNTDAHTFRVLDYPIKSYFERLHVILSRVTHIVPLSVAKLLRYLGEGFPFRLRPEEEHLLYTYNVLALHRRRPMERSAVFGLLIDYIVKMDTEASPQELSEIDLEDESDDEDGDDNAAKPAPPVSWKIEHPIAERLDLVMTLVFEYIDELAGPSGDTNHTHLQTFYQESIPAFEGVIFKTHGLTHVQFIWFYMASLSGMIAEDFQRRLCLKILNPNVPAIFRQYSVCYVSSYMARAKFVPIRVVIKFVDQMVQWIHDYISENDALYSALDREKIHRAFYAVCQNVFYLLTFRHREILGQQKGLLWFKTLNMERIIMCRLNPFRYTQKIVVELFAAVTRQFNLLFCYTVIERNNRLLIFSGPKDDTDELREANPLNTFFPFEPFVLKRSKRFVTPNYRTYDEPVSEEQPGEIATAYRGLIADSEESEESRDSDVVEEQLLPGKTFPPRKSRKRQLSENNN
ncbi:RNA polymerase I-specific transcription initiation factor RRN3 [Hypsibius exemplaris]|uniref:RNA polymerase I-specific transcription initiation factor RRN3 n=1 Tax=Hypsibius exemplaris TaxID=2072580 RepID=A0A1W0W874_HYPEX|nr:RNA polymerase I-specific transcription initiation factor RRN3 [Hypsibius exemplaris]